MSEPLSDKDARQLAMLLEDQIDGEGWDQHGRLFVVLRPERHQGMVIPLVGEIPGNPGEFIEWLGDQMATSSEEFFQEMVKTTAEEQDFIGFILVSESWANTTLTHEEGQAWRDAGKSLADHPTSYESRDLTMITVWGQLQHVHRKRGDPPVDKDTTSLQGRIPEGLIQMMTAVTALMPDDRCDREKIKALASKHPHGMSEEQWNFRMAAYLEKVKEKIAEHGWMVQGVFSRPGDKPEPEFAYTVGMTEAGLPELIVSGSDQATMANLLNELAARHLKDELTHGQEITLDDDWALPLRIIDAPDTVPGTAGRLYGDRVTFRQAVWFSSTYDGYPGSEKIPPEDFWQLLYGDVWW